MNKAQLAAAIAALEQQGYVVVRQTAMRRLLRTLGAALVQGDVTRALRVHTELEAHTERHRLHREDTTQ